MAQSYKIDRIEIITYPRQKTKHIHSYRCRYLAKSHIVKCIAKGERFDYVNFRGSIITKVDFSKSVFNGCDFWGASFKDCNFADAEITDSVFMACKFHNCRFHKACFNYVTIVNTSLNDCLDVDTTKGVRILKEYPKIDVCHALESVIQSLSSDKYIKKYKILKINEKKINHLNTYCLSISLKTNWHDCLMKCKSFLQKRLQLTKNWNYS